MSVLNDINLEDVKFKLYDKLKASGWGDKLKTFIMSEDFDKILNYLLKEAKEGRRFTPVLKQVFRAFEECPFDNLKVVIVGQDPYPQIGEADGISFSCSNTGRPAASLRYMFKEIERTAYSGYYPGDPDLSRWSNQGLLMLNSALTTTVNKSGTHYAIWQPFLAFLFDILTFQKPDLVYVYMGRKAQEWMDSVPDNCIKITCSHPASAAYKEAENWESGDVFNKISKAVKDKFNYDIKW